MLLSLYQEIMGTGNPAGLAALVPGGAGGNAATTPLPTVPWLNVYTVEPTLKEVNDQTVAAPAVQGNFVSMQTLSTNTGAGNFALGYNGSQTLGRGNYGIVTKAAISDSGITNPGGSALIMLDGVCQALCVTGTNAIVPGTPLTSDGKGNLQPFPLPSGAPTPTVTPVGTAGAVTVTYGLVPISYDGVLGAIGTTANTTTSNATGSGANYNLITWTPAADAAGYLVVRTTASGYTPSTVGVIGQVGPNVGSFADTGLAIITGTSATSFAVAPATPSAPTVAQVSGATAGTTSYAYKISAIGPNGVWSAESSASTTLTTGAAVLSATQGNKITWTNVAGAVAYAIDRTTTGTNYTTGFIGFSLANSGNGFVDQGQAAITMAAAGQNLASANNPNPTPRAGSVVAIALGSLAASTTTPTLTTVKVGGF